MNWECVSRSESEQTWRAKVPGGWFVQVYTDWDRYDRDSNTSYKGVVMSAFFYPDPTHMWNGSSMTAEQVVWNGKVYDNQHEIDKAHMEEHARKYREAKGR